MRLTLVLALVAVVGVAQAGDPQGAHRPGYAMDSNNDGVVSREEAKDFPRLSESFDAWDKNKDGQLDQAEVAAHRDAMHGEMRAKAHERWRAADKDGNGSLSREEVESSMPRMADRFKEMDLNDDGQISRDERHDFGMAGPKHERKDMKKRFKAADTNGDDALDLAEVQAGMPWMAERFSTMDADKDGKLTRDECRAAMKRP